ncbi:hypothetical protein [Amycolatopsis alkalitolerans]|uniref:Uncharacterized protein n=1 Tax=Amycolatopsis alkalitolerans TaxID=2547244 RepID=A0A5C4LRF5_9PSEU|nr:hypothetical protein [Amycolatopsis alkalitolerans]TNC19087.1 hypothetical protein FG385_33010 [Amycolatopsis alkalitolerans]
MTERWWAPRREGEATADYLARVLDELGADELAEQARACHFDDYRCPPDVDDGANIHRLVAAIEKWAMLPKHVYDPLADRWGDLRAGAVIDAAKTGEFDGTWEEARAWAESPEGGAMFDELGRES